MDPTTTGADSAAVLALRRAVVDELEWDPRVEAVRIGVSAADGVVTLTGAVANAAERTAARHATFRVRGVRSVADQLHVHRTTWDGLSDEDIAENVANALELVTGLPAGVVQASVHDGEVTLTGEVSSNEQHASTREAVEHLVGVTRVHDWIVLSGRPSAVSTAARIHAALVRSAVVDADSIRVEVEGTTVRLEGAVRSFAEKEEAVRAAWRSPHVTAVEDRIAISP
jgi:osmotically-inducible protein OsmY